MNMFFPIIILLTKGCMNELNDDLLLIELISGLIYFDVGTKRPKIVLNHNDFTMVNHHLNKTYWRCTSYYKTKCKSNITTTGRMAIVGSPHNHEPNRKNIEFKTLLCQQVTITRKPYRC